MITERARAAGLHAQRAAVHSGARPELIRAVLAGLRSEYGGASGYLTCHGVAPEAIAQLRAHLIG
jgi:hypothetical protein